MTQVKAHKEYFFFKYAWVSLFGKQLFTSIYENTPSTECYNSSVTFFPLLFADKTWIFFAVQVKTTELNVILHVNYLSSFTEYKITLEFCFPTFIVDIWLWRRDLENCFRESWHLSHGGISFHVWSQNSWDFNGFKTEFSLNAIYHIKKEFIT